MRTSLRLSNIPEYMHEGIINYLFYHVEPGDFLRNLLQNNLLGTFGNADSTNSSLIKEYILFFYKNVPIIVWGSEEKYNKWINKRKEKKE